MSLNSSTNLTVFQRSEWYLQSLKSGMASALRTCTQLIACVFTCPGRWNGQERWCSRPRSCPGHPSGVCTTRSGLRPVNGAAAVSTPAKTRRAMKMPRSGSSSISCNQSSVELLRDYLGCGCADSFIGAAPTLGECDLELSWLKPFGRVCKWIVSGPASRSRYLFVPISKGSA